jgi:hypothetical protein
MKPKTRFLMKKGKVLAFAGLASLVISCSSSPKNIQKPQLNIAKVDAAAENAVMGQVFLQGKSLDDYFNEFNSLSPEQQEYSVKSLNNLSAWDTILLSRYIPIDGILGKLSSFYSTDYKEHLQSLFAASVLDPIAVGPTGDKGLGQLSQSSEKWARELYNNKKLGYKFSGQEITKDSSDPYTNLVLSSILFRKAAEEKILDLDSLAALYSKGFKGVSQDKDGLYATNEFGLSIVNRLKTFDSIADKMILFSWVSMNRPELIKYIDNPNLKMVMWANKDSYDAKPAYEDMISFLNSTSTDKKYSDENRKMFKNETINISKWIKNLYGK